MTRRSCSSPHRPARLRLAQRLHQIAGLRLKRLLRIQQRCHLRRERAVGLRARLLQFPHLLIHLLERFGDRLDERLDRFLPRFQLSLGLRLVLLQRGPGKIEKVGVVAFQR